MALPLEQIQMYIEGALAGKLSTVAKGTVQVQVKGWNKAVYTDAVTGVPIIFSTPPTVVAAGLYREGLMKTPTAPTISIPLVELPAAPVISIPNIELPPIPDITLPDFTGVENTALNSLYAVRGYRFVCGVAFSWLCDQLNKLMVLWDDIVNALVNLVLNLGDIFSNLKQNLQSLISSVKALHDNAQAALNQYQANIQSSINSALTDTRNKIQAALNTYQQTIQNSINTGLAAVIPALYDMIGIGTLPRTASNSTEKASECRFHILLWARKHCSCTFFIPSIWRAFLK
jgi:ElaB/YqjD/DUF883 family membrane-anchored ribosome-binding protein